MHACRVYCHPVNDDGDAPRSQCDTFTTYDNGDSLSEFVMALFFFLYFSFSVAFGIVGSENIYRDGERRARIDTPRKMPGCDKRSATFLLLRATLLSRTFVNKGDRGR